MMYFLSCLILFFALFLEIPHEVYVDTTIMSTLARRLFAFLPPPAVLFPSFGRGMS